MRPATRRLVSVAALIFAVWVAGTVVSIVAGWPAQFGGPGDPDDVTGEFLSRGTVFSPPLALMVALVVFALLAPSRRWWGTLGVVGLCLLAVITLVGSLGEAFAPSTPDVPRAALVASGVVGRRTVPGVAALRYRGAHRQGSGEAAITSREPGRPVAPVNVRCKERLGYRSRPNPVHPTRRSLWRRP